jgi:hypothetical protein
MVLVFTRATGIMSSIEPWTMKPPRLNLYILQLAKQQKLMHSSTTTHYASILCIPLHRSTTSLCSSAVAFLLSLTACLSLIKYSSARSVVNRCFEH